MLLDTAQTDEWIVIWLLIVISTKILYSFVTEWQLAFSDNSAVGSGLE